MDSGGHDVGGFFSGKLHDILPQVGLQGFNACVHEGLVETDFLGHHRLSLHDQLDIVFFGDFQAALDGRLPVPCKMDVPASLPNLIRQGFQEDVQVFDGLFSDFMGSKTQFGSFRKRLIQGGCGRAQAILDIPQGIL